MFKLSWHGFALLGVVFGLMLLLSYQGLSRWSHIRSLDQSITRNQQEIELLQPDLTHIGQIQTQITDYRQNLDFMDSLIVDPGKWSRLFSKFMQDFKSVNRIWIENIKSDPGGFTMVGKTLNRDRVPKLANCLPSVDLKRVTRVINENGEVTYEYELAAGIPAPDTARIQTPFQPGADKVNTPGGAIAAEATPAMKKAQQASPPDMTAEATSPAESMPAATENAPTEATPPTLAQVMQGPMPLPPGTKTQDESAGDSKKMYDEGIKLIQSGDIAGAEQAFSTLLQQYPNSRRAAAARYWLGECRYAKGDYPTAAEDFAASLANESNTKRESALLMLGLTYLKMGQDEKAKTQFEALLNEFPSGEYSQKARSFIQQLTTQG